MLKNLVDEDYLKGYTVKLNDLLYTGEADWSEQKSRANQFVFNQLTQRGYDVKKLMPELVLRTAGTSESATAYSSGVQDTITRLRLVIDTITNTLSSKTLTLQGSNDNSTFYDITDIIVATDDTSKSIIFFDTYSYYRIKTTIVSGAIDFRAYLNETVYDELFATKWLVFIFADIRKADGDQFDLRMRHYEDMYNQIMGDVTIYIDSNNDGIPDSNTRTGTLTMTR